LVTDVSPETGAGVLLAASADGVSVRGGTGASASSGSIVGAGAGEGATEVAFLGSDGSVSSPVSSRFVLLAKEGVSASGSVSAEESVMSSSSARSGASRAARFRGAGGFLKGSVGVGTSLATGGATSPAGRFWHSCQNQQAASACGAAHKSTTGSESAAGRTAFKRIALPCFRWSMGQQGDHFTANR
jgi:hypothetical protein